MLPLRQHLFCLLCIMDVGYTFRIFDNFELVEKFTDPVERALNHTLTPESRCRNDVLYWFQSLHQFTKALISNCNDADIRCIRNRQINIDRHFFAAKQVDSFGRIPANVLEHNTFWLGSWEECLDINSMNKPNYKTQFCYMQFSSSLISSHYVLRDYQMTDMCRSPLLLRWSICVPNSCNEQDITTIFRNFYNQTNGPLQLCSIKCRQKAIPPSNKSFVFVLALLLLLTILLIVSTLLDYVLSQRFKTTKNIPTSVQCILTFSLFTNGSEVLSLKKDPEQIQCLYCIRTITACWIIMGNAYAYYLDADNPITMLQHSEDTANKIFLSSHMGADTFFFISGLMVSYMFFKSVVNGKQKFHSPTYWIKYYIHRYIRLSPAYFMVIIFVAVIYNHLTIGPLSFERILDPKACTTDWWWNVLYINKVYGNGGNCLPQSWYLAVDFQLYAIAPVVLILLHISSTAGYSAIVVVLVATAAINCAVYIKYDLPVNYVIYFADIYDNTITTNYNRLVNYAIWLRNTPYLVGVFTGYFLRRHQKKCFHLKTNFITLAWIGAVLLGISCIFGLDDIFYRFSQKYCKIVKVITAYCLRFAWTLVLAWIIVACENEYAGVLKNVMELNLWRPLGRLTYCAFLTQNFLLPLIFSMERHPLHFVNSYFIFFRDVVPMVVVTFVLSFFWSCFFEIPFIKQESLVLRIIRSRRRRQFKDSDNITKNETLLLQKIFDRVENERYKVYPSDRDMRF